MLVKFSIETFTRDSKPNLDKINRNSVVIHAVSFAFMEFFNWAFWDYFPFLGHR